jgi:ABC-type transport system involved in cytochrome c biogenesis permease subunit
MAELPLLWTAFAGYLAAGSLAIGALALGRRPERAILGLLAAGLALHSLSIALRWERLGHGPFITMFEVLSSNIWSLTLLFALAYWRVRAVRPAAPFVMPILLMMMAWNLTTDSGEGYYPPTFHTHWLWVHVGFGKLFLGAVLVAVGISGIVLARWAGFGAARLARLPASERLDDLAFRFMAAALIFQSLMLVAGAIWAQDAWGRYWAWDPLETWSFLTWLALVAALHARAAFRVGPSAGAAMIVGVFVLAFFTLFGVPFVSTAFHKGAV